MTASTTNDIPSGRPRDDVQRRTLATLSLSSVAGRAAMSAGFTIAALALGDMLSRPALVGLSTVAITLGSAFSASWISNRMDRLGRRSGFEIGFVVAIGGALLAGLAVRLDSIPLFLLGLAAFGVGQAGTNLARYGAVDLAAPATRSRAISVVVFASAFGAAAGPLAVQPASDLAERLNWPANAGPFGAAALFYVLAGLVTTLGLRPDPLLTARARLGGNAAQRASVATAGRRSAPKASWATSLGHLTATPAGTIALAGLVVSQAVMVMVMSMTPLHMDAHGHDKAAIGAVISVHTIGMYLFAPIAGWASDRFGRQPVIGLGAGILAVSTAITALAGDAPKILMLPGLYLLGLGWSFAMVASSALISESVDDEVRVGVQGVADVLTSLTSGAGALAAGFVFDMAGFHLLSTLGIVASGLLLVATFSVTRRAQLRFVGPSSR